MPASVESSLIVVACIPAEFAWDGGEPARKLHVTLAYLGKGFDADAAAMTVNVATRVAAGHQPLVLDIGGVGMLGEDGAIVAHVNGDGLTAMREHLVNELSAAFGRDMSGKYDGYVPHITLAYRRTADGALVTDMHDRYFGQSIPVTDLAVWSGNEPVATMPLGQLTTSLVRNTSLVPRDHLGTWEIDLLRVGQSSGVRRFSIDDAPDGHQFWRSLPLPLQATTLTTSGHLGADNAGAIAEIELGDDGVLRARGWFSADEIGYRTMAKALKGEVTGQSVDLDEDTLVTEVPADNAYGMEAVYTRWRISGATITPHPALPSAGVMRVMLNPDLDGSFSPTIIPGAAGRQAMPDGQRAKTSSGAVVASAGITAPPAIWREAERRIASHLASGGRPENISQLFTGLTGDMVLDAPANWFTDPKLKAPTAPTFKDGRFFGHLALWGVCHRGLGVSVGANGCVMAPRSPTGYSQFNLVPLPLGDGSTVKVGKLTVGTGHAGPELSADRSAAHYDDTGWTAGYVRVGEDKHGIWFSGVPSPFATEDQIWSLITSQLSGDWRYIGKGLELIAALSVNVPGFSIPDEARVGFTSEGHAFSMLIPSPKPEFLVYATASSNTLPPVSLCACGANTECGCNKAAEPEMLTTGCASCRAAEQFRLEQEAAAIEAEHADLIMAHTVDAATGVATVRFNGGEFSSAAEFTAAVADYMQLQLVDGNFVDPAALATITAAAAERKREAYVFDLIGEKLGIVDPMIDIERRLNETASA